MQHNLLRGFLRRQVGRVDRQIDLGRILIRIGNTVGLFLNLPLSGGLLHPVDRIRLHMQRNARRGSVAVHRGTSFYLTAPDTQEIIN